MHLYYGLKVCSGFTVRPKLFVLRSEKFDLLRPDERNPNGKMLYNNYLNSTCKR